MLKKKDVNFEKDLRKKASYFVDILKKLPPLHEEVLLIYENQDTGEIIGSVKVPFDEKWIDEKIKFARDYWQGKREALKVSERNRWKCNYCDLSEYCF